MPRQGPDKHLSLAPNYHNLLFRRAPVYAIFSHLGNRQKRLRTLTAQKYPENLAIHFDTLCQFLWLPQPSKP